MSDHPANEGSSEEHSAAFRWIFNTFRRGTIRKRLLVAFLVMVLLPAVAISIGLVFMGYQSGRQQTIERLELAAAFKETEIDNWIDSLHTGLNYSITEMDAILFARVILKQELTIAGSDNRGNFEMRLSRYIERTQQFEELFLLDLEGLAIASSDKTQRGMLHGDQSYFQEGLGSFYVSFYYPASDQVVVAASQPVLDKDGETIGVFVGYASLDALNEIMREQIRMGATGKTYLVDRNYDLLTKPYLDGVHTEGVEAVLEAQVNGHGSYEDYRGKTVVGVYHWLPDLQIALLAEQDQTEAFRTVYVTLIISIIMTLVSVFVAVGASLFVTRTITAPIIQLVEATDRISMGDLEAGVKVSPGDEIGDLAESIERMRISLKAAMERLRGKT